MSWPFSDQTEEGGLAGLQLLARDQGEAGRTLPLGEDGNSTLMSWTLFADMTDGDLGAIYAYLMASEARSNSVVVWD